MAGPVGIARSGPQPAPTAASGGAVDELVGLLADQRDDAWRRHDYHRADRIRQGLADLDVELVDTPTGSRWWRR